MTNILKNNLKKIKNVSYYLKQSQRKTFQKFLDVKIKVMNSKKAQKFDKQLHNL